MGVSSERFSLKSFQPLVTINVPEKECLVEDESTQTVENTETVETNETVESTDTVKDTVKTES